MALINGLIYNTIAIHMFIVNKKSPNTKKTNSNVNFKS